MKKRKTNYKIYEKSEIIRLFRWLFSKKSYGILKVNRFLIFPFFAVYLFANFMSVLFFFYDAVNSQLYFQFDDYIIEKYGYSKGINIICWMENLSMWNYTENRHIPEIVAFIFMAMAFTDLICFPAKKSLSFIKWILYFVMIIITVLIAYITFPAFYDYIIDFCTSI